VGNLTRADWTAVERLFHEAVERPRAERSAFLASACGGADALRKEVESLLARDDERALDEPALDLAAREIAARQRAARAGAGHETPSLVGRRLRSYEVLSLLGAGGMGEVYRARDTTLGREVALKLLPRELSSDPERLRRLEREARLLASLEHPSIAVLHSLEEADGLRFLVMELVPGPTLAERLHRGPVPLAEALAVGRQMAEALEAAHDRGVVHRDLKPGNVKVTPDGRVKLLDFGLAKALTEAGSDVASKPDGETTRDGVILGTPAYMSPEQARGEPVDRRTDIWSFGCCLYETLTGRRAFAGKTTSDTLAAILDREPDWSALPERTPGGALRVLRRCLTKDVRHRLQHIGDARLELEEAASGRDERPERQPRRRVSWFLAGAALLAALAAGLAGGLAWRATARQGVAPRPAEPVRRLTLRLEGESTGALDLSVARVFTPFALSPDGARLVFQAFGPRGHQLFLRELSESETRPLPGTERATAPFFSPDGQWVGFWRAEDRKIWKTPVSGGPPIAIGVTDQPSKPLWGADDEILFQGDVLWSISAFGGEPRAVPIRDRSEDEWIPLRDRIPGRRDLLVMSWRPGDADNWLEVLSRETARRRRLLRGARMQVARVTPTAHIVYGDGDPLFAVPVDPERLEPLGVPVPVIRGIHAFANHVHVAVSETGTVVYLPAERVRKAELFWMDRAGKASPVPHGDSVEPSSFSVSPGGREAAVELLEGGVWILDLERGSRRLLAEQASGPIFSRDGVFVTYWSPRPEGVVCSRRRVDGTAEEERLFVHSAGWTSDADWSPDGRSLLFTSHSSACSDVWIFADGQASPLLDSPAAEWLATFSPDGRFFAFDVSEAGQSTSTVYVQPFPGSGPRTAVSVGDGNLPWWGRDGRHLYYVSGRKKVMSVAVQTEPTLRLGRPQLMFEAEADLRWQGFDVTADGRLLVSRPRRTEGPAELEVILNWFEELERLAPHPRR
jgi:serine/threonine-protein kinase